MALAIPYTFTGGVGNKAKASQVNANFQAIAAKFQEGPGGIGDADCAATMGLKGSKLSNIPGSRIPNDRFEDDTVDARVLRDDASVDANRSVTTDHIRDGAVTTAKVGANAVVNSKIKFTEYSALASTLFGTASIGAHASRYASTGLDKTTLRLVGVYIESAGIYTAGSDQAPAPILHAFTRAADSLVYLALTNAHSSSLTISDYTVRLVYVSNS